jgi:ArsR family transcriptional regulator
MRCVPVAKVDAFEGRSVDLAAFAKALAHPARICILRYLAGKGEVPCMEIVAALPLSQPACSRHINELRKAGLLVARSRGNQVLFRIDESALRRFCQGMNEALHPESVRR